MSTVTRKLNLMSADGRRVCVHPAAMESYQLLKSCPRQYSLKDLPRAVIENVLSSRCISFVREEGVDWVIDEFDLLEMADIAGTNCLNGILRSEMSDEDIRLFSEAYLATSLITSAREAVTTVSLIAQYYDRLPPHRRQSGLAGFRVKSRRHLAALSGVDRRRITSNGHLRERRDVP